MRKPMLMIVFVLFLPAAGFACVCDTTPSVGRALKEATSVFTGRYIGSEFRKGIKNEFMEMRASWGEPQREYEVLVHKFEVEKIWKGALAREIVLISDHTRSSDGSETISDCDLGFETGKEYLIYAYGTRDDFGSGACTRTKSLSRAANDVRQLNRITRPRKP